MADSLYISLFGGLKVELNGQPVSLLTRKNEALFAYLACHPQQKLRRESLATMFWSEKDERAAMGNLRTALSGLRTMHSLPDYLEIERFTLGIRSNQNLWVDVLVFEKLEQTVLRTSPSGLLTDVELNALSEAVSLYRGEFLEGFSVRDADRFDEWTRNQRERFQVCATRALQKLITHSLAAEDYQAGIVWAQRLIELAASEEAPRRDLMVLLASSGQLTAALQQYEIISRRLQEEGEEPSAETKRLYQQIVNSGRQVSSQRVAAPPTQIPNTNLIQPITPIIGRQEEIERVCNRLADERCHLITLVGPGGVGKTRLATAAGLHMLTMPEASSLFRDGVYFIALQSVDQPALLSNAIAGVVGCQMQGVFDPTAQLIAYLRPRQMLLILDNFEHLLEAADLVLQILQQIPTVKVLTTSLEPLNFQGEWLQQVQGLPAPQDKQDAAWDEYPAVQLFLHSVEQFDAAFDGSAEREQIIDICQYVQGLPLGILLAASAVRTYTCQTIALELRRNLDFLATTLRNIPARHRSLRAVFDYVWQLLDAKGHRLLPRLAVFEGGFTATAAQVVADISPYDLADYANRSLFQRSSLVNVPDQNGTITECQAYTFHRALHGYFLEKLASDNQQYQAVCRRHCDYFTKLLEQQRSQISGAKMSESLAAIQSQLANIRSAWQYAATFGLIDKLEAGYETLAQYYLRSGPFVEGQLALQMAIDTVRQNLASAATPVDCTQLLLARLLINSGHFSIELSNFLAALETADEAATIATPLQDNETLALVHLVRGRAHYYMGAHEKARKHLEQAQQFTATQQLHRIEAQLELYLGNVYGAQSNYTASRERLLLGLEFCRRDHDPMTELLFYRSLGRIAIFVGDYSEATALHEQVLQRYNNLGARAGTGIVLNNLGAILHQVGDYERAREYYLNALDVLRDIGDLRYQGLTTTNLCLLDYSVNDMESALRHGQEALRLAQLRNYRDTEAYVRNCLGHIWRVQKDLTRAEQYYREALALRLELEQPGQKLEPISGLASIALDKGDVDTAKQYVEQIYASLQQGRPGGIVEFIRILLVCFDTFKACNDPRTVKIIELGAEILGERASKISKPSQRRSYLWRVASHRRLMTLAEEYKIALPDWLLRTG